MALRLRLSAAAGASPLDSKALWLLNPTPKIFEAKRKSQMRLFLGVLLGGFGCGEGFAAAFGGGCPFVGVAA